MSAAPIKMLRPLGLALALAGASAPALAQEEKPTEAELEQAAKTLSLIVSALNSKDVPQPTKNGLFQCLYENPLRRIADASGRIVAKTVDPEAVTPTEELLVVATVCGAPIPKPAEGEESGESSDAATDEGSKAGESGDAEAGSGADEGGSAPDGGASEADPEGGR